MTDERERERALQRYADVLKIMGDALDDVEPRFSHRHAKKVLAEQPVVLIPRAEYDALVAENERGKRALWELMEEKGFPRDSDALLGGEFLESIGFVRVGLHNEAYAVWTDKAREFAKEMEASK